MRIKSRLQRKGERGQAFLELAVSLVFLLILLAAVIDLGWAFYTLIAMRDAAQEAASYAALCPVLDGETDKNYSGVETRLKASASAPLNINDINLDPIKDKIRWFEPDGVTPLADTDLPQRGDMVKVRFTVYHHILTPFVGTFIGTWEYPLEVEVADTVMSNLCPKFSVHPTPTPTP